MSTERATFIYLVRRLSNVTPLFTTYLYVMIHFLLRVAKRKNP